MQELVEAQIARTPDAVAAVSADTTVSYRELGARADRLARELRRLGVRPGAVVGVCLERSIALAVAALAVLKAGGAYLPLEPIQPPERLRFMLGDAGAAALRQGAGRRVTGGELRAQVPGALPVGSPGGGSAIDRARAPG